MDFDELPEVPKERCEDSEPRILLHRAELCDLDLPVPDEDMRIGTWSCGHDASQPDVSLHNSPSQWDAKIERNDDCSGSEGRKKLAPADGRDHSVNDKTLIILQSWCSDRDPMCWRFFATLGRLLLFALAMALCVLWAYVFFPFDHPEVGFWQNWVFNFVAHPVANYIVAGGVVNWFARQVLWNLENHPVFCRAQRPDIVRRIHLSSLLTPLVDSLWCASEHVVFSFFGIYPIPFSAPLSCIPGASASFAVMYLVLPKEVRALQTTWPSLKFTACAWITYCLMYSMMLFYTAIFVMLEKGAQLAASLLLWPIESLMVFGTSMLGRRWDLPPQILCEIRTCLRLPVIIFKASILSEAKGMGVLLTMILPEAVQVGRFAFVVFSDVLVRGQNGLKPQSILQNLRWDQISSLRQLLQTCCHVLHGFRDLRNRLKDMAQRCRAIRKEDLKDVTWSLEDVKLLNQISSSLSLIVMLELCEVLAPVIFISLVLCLQSNTFLGQNTSHFMTLADVKFEESLIANGYSLAIEVGMLLVSDAAMRALIGISFFRITLMTLRCDFFFWLSNLSMSYVAWLTMLVRHSGHDLTFRFSWLS